MSMPLSELCCMGVHPCIPHLQHFQVWYGATLGWTLPPAKQRAQRRQDGGLPHLQVPHAHEREGVGAELAIGCADDARLGCPGLDLQRMGVGVEWEGARVQSWQCHIWLQATLRKLRVRSCCEMWGQPAGCPAGFYHGPGLSPAPPLRPAPTTQRLPISSAPPPEHRRCRGSSSPGAPAPPPASPAAPAGPAGPTCTARRGCPRTRRTAGRRRRP